MARWQFHAGDNLGWAKPNIDDATGHDGWEQLTADAPWGTQHHPNYDGPGWYRRRIDLTTAPGAPGDVALLIPAIDDIYELYWNGNRSGISVRFRLILDFSRAPYPHRRTAWAHSQWCSRGARVEDTLRFKR